MWGVGCGVWGVGCGVWGVGCGAWGVGRLKAGAKHPVILQYCPSDPSNGQASEYGSPAADKSPFRAVGRGFQFFLTLRGVHAG
jgi:hypothetical protein